jgi:pilus assembly protein CpaC
MLSASDGTSTIMPVVSTRQIDTTVQLGDGQSFAVAGLIRNNLTQSVSRFPGLGDLPILGALFRSTAFQKDQTELVFVVTPRLVQPIAQALLPTDVHREPSRQDAILDGRAERGPRPPAPPTAPPTAQPTAPPALPTDTRSQP